MISKMEISSLKDYLETNEESEPRIAKGFLEDVISMFEEIQQYRAIGTVARFQQLTEQFKPHVTDKTSCPRRGCNKCDKYRKENEKYREIGTVEECREAREREIGKKPYVQSDGHGGMEVHFHECPNCDSFLGYVSDCKDEQYQDSYCRNCGQAIDWS